MPAVLSRQALKRVVESLLRAELAGMHGRRAESVACAMVSEPWPEDFDFSSSGHEQMGCDSLELLQLSAAINEMFHLYEVGLESELLASAVFDSWLTLIESAWQRGVNHVTFMTSGSTGVPKRCTHCLDHLNTEVSHLASFFSTRTRIVGCTPARHIYGFLFTALLPDRLGIPVVDLGRPADATAAVATRSFQAGDLIVSVPEVWAWLQRSVPGWHGDIEGVVSTAPCPRDTIESLARAGLARITEVYGSTETAGIGLRAWPEAAYTLMPHWTYRPVSDVTERAVLQTADMKVTPMDVLRFFDDRHFVVEGRSDGAVQVGGSNVFLKDVERALSAHPGVRSAAVRLMRPEEGSRLKCFIVPSQDVDVDSLRGRLEGHVVASLKAVERPKVFTFGSDLPRNALGKLCDW